MTNTWGIIKCIDITAAALSSLKSIKMVGLADKLVKLIQSLRINELKLASGFRIVLASNLCIGNQRTQALNIE